MLPKTGIEMYQQRLFALHKSQIYTHSDYEIDQPNYQDWLDILKQESDLIKDKIAKKSDSSRLNILLGDSLSMWFPNSLLPSGTFWLNQGISGDTTSGILKRLDIFAKNNPNNIYILAGINDLKRQVPVAEILENHQKILDYLQYNYPDTRILVQSIFPTQLPTETLTFSIPNSLIKQLNQNLAQQVNDRGSIYLDFHQRFTNTQGNLRSELTTDGLHLSPEGYKVWQFALKQTESRLSKNRDHNYQKWLQKSSELPLDGQSYSWVSYQVKPGDTLEKITLKALGREDFDYCDLIAIRNNLTSDFLLIDDRIEIPQLIQK
ncbi:Lipolytic enzyme, G-D-S-L [Planktothrix sp. PCC 11201]|uniref:GDSL-type esterase/lipase family protein n=1 Tax=Planktothrix sp. PCC 11201 TaxID=1729650 RepID=UPI000912A00A|nr:GDSL-type esterase/lipase family protein [Planktothrix sp. PCC 11201]SKB14985.1 Lipolytic enzyme, G-D-S-L [Planktothrix sp. PCC 11201]